MRILCAAQLRLGRRLAGLPSHLDIDESRLSHAVAWNRLVDTARSQRVDAVLLAGDLMDRENHGLGAIGDLRQGLSQLAEAGIPVVAIAGGDDATTLPDIVSHHAASLLTLLAPGRSTRVGTADRQLRIAAGTPGRTGANGDAPDVTLMYASLADAAAGDGAVHPVSLDALAGAGRTVILGAAPDPDVLRRRGQLIVECGSLVAADEDQTGPHGCVLLDTESQAARIIPLAPVQFASVDVAVEPSMSMDDIESGIVAAVENAVKDARAEDRLRSVSHVVCRVNVSGQTPHHGDLRAAADSLASTIFVHMDGVVGVVSAIELDTTPEIDLALLIDRPDPVGELARLIRALDGDAELSPAQRALIERAGSRYETVRRSRAFASITGDSDDPEIDVRLRHLAWDALDALVRQRGVG